MAIKRKALVVGIGEYFNNALPLPAAPREAIEWKRLLEQNYGFHVDMLLDAQATKDNIRDALIELLSDAEEGNARIYCHIGHGTVVPIYGGGDYDGEQALLTYVPEDTPAAQMTASDLAKAFRAANLAAGVASTVVIDACFSGRLDIPIQNRRRAFAPVYTGLDTTDMRLRQFGSMMGLLEREMGPLIVAACGADQTASHLIIDGEWRSLFSRRAVDHLWSQKPTFRELVQAIYPLWPEIPQKPDLRGNTSFADGPFPGVTELEARPASVATVGSVNVRFTGICCFADPKASGTFAKRVLIPYDSRSEPALRHIAFLEVAQDEVDGYTGRTPKVSQHYGGGVYFNRWDLSGHKIEFLNANTTAGPLTYKTTYTQYVPGLKTGILSSLDPSPRDECYDTSPPANIVAGFVDLYVGSLGASNIDENIVLFITNGGAVSSWKRRPPLFVDLELPLTETAAKIRLTKDAEVTEITLKPYATPLIGNEREMDIAQDPRVPENPRDHFHLYYQLARPGTVSADPPLPLMVAVPQTFCSPTGWP